MIHTPEELKQLTELRPEVTEWLKAHPLPLIPDVSPALQFRMVMSFVDAQIKENFPESEEGVVEEDREISMRDGFRSRLRITRPARRTIEEGSPLFVWIYGGGFVGGTPDQVIPRARHLVKLFVCCAPSYKLAPENKFPAAPNDVYDHLKWIASNAESFGADPKLGFILGGDSAGGNLAAVAVRRAHVEEPLAHAITGQWMECPFLFPLPEQVSEQYRAAFLSREHGKDTPFVTTVDMDGTPAIMDWNPLSTLQTPVNYRQDYKGMPRTYFCIAGADPMRDDGLIYDEMLKADGVDTMVDVYAGCPHAHMLFMPDTEIAKEGLIDSLQGAAWLLNRTVTKEQILTAAPKLKVN